MRRGTTPTITITLDSELESVASRAVLTLKQGDTILNIDVEIDDNTIVTTLTQKQTLMFNSRNIVEIQVKIKLENGKTVATDIGKVYFSEILNEEVL